MSASEPTYDDPVVVEEPAAPARNPLMVVAAVAGGLALAALVWFFLVTPLLLGDDAGANDPAAAPDDGTVTDPDATPSPSAPETADPEVDEVEDLPIVTFEVFLARDPFEPVVPEPADTTDNTTVPGPGENSNDDPTQPTDPTDPTQPGTPTDPTQPGTQPTDPTQPGTSPTQPAPPRTPTCTDDDPPVCDGRVVSLVEITGDGNGRLAVIQVDTTIYEVREGDLFAGSFLVRSITADSVQLSYGDDGLTLRPGERVLK